MTKRLNTFKQKNQQQKARGIDFLNIPGKLCLLTRNRTEVLYLKCSTSIFYYLIITLAL